MHSYKDSRGKLVVDCTECTRGYNGDRSCACGWYHEKPGMGCFLGQLLPCLKEEESRCCDECGAEGAYDTEAGWLCGKCEKEYREALQEQAYNDPDNYCVRCGEYSTILERGKCPMCFELSGYV